MLNSLILPDHPALEVIESVNARQMIYTAGDARSDAECSPLTPAHIQQMVALVALTNPGPFGPRTIELGSYCGASWIRTGWWR